MNITQHTIPSTNIALASSGYWRNYFPNITGTFCSFYSPLSSFTGGAYQNINSIGLFDLLTVERIAPMAPTVFYNKPIPYGVFINI